MYLALNLRAEYIICAIYASQVSSCMQGAIQLMEYCYSDKGSRWWVFQKKTVCDKKWSLLFFVCKYVLVMFTFRISKQDSHTILAQMYKRNDGKSFCLNSSSNWNLVKVLSMVIMELYVYNHYKHSTCFYLIIFGKNLQ